MSTHVAAILLAAGRSRRMGACKQLLPLGKNTVIGCCLETLISAGIDPIVVVVSPEGGSVADAVKPYPAAIAVNNCEDGDMASSVCAGRDALTPACSGVIVALGDSPLVRHATVAALAGCHAAFPDRIIIPVHEGRRGHPVLFPRPILDELAAAMTLRDLLRHDPDRIRHLNVHDQGILVDLDTPDDYRRVCAGAHAERS